MRRRMRAHLSGRMTVLDVSLPLARFLAESMLAHQTEDSVAVNLEALKLALKLESNSRTCFLLTARRTDGGRVSAHVPKIS